MVVFPVQTAIYSTKEISLSPNSQKKTSSSRNTFSTTLTFTFRTPAYKNSKESIIAMSTSPSKANPSIPADLIPQRLSLKLHSLSTYTQALERSRYRKASNQSQLSTSASFSDFLSLKVKDAEEDANDCSILYSIAQDALQRQVITQKDFQELSRELEKKREQKTDETCMSRSSARSSKKIWRSNCVTE